MVWYTVIEGYCWKLHVREREIAKQVETVVPSEYVRKLLTTSRLKVDKVVPHGIDFSIIPSEEKVRRYRERFQNRKILLYIAGYHKRKGFEQLTEAVRYLKTIMKEPFIVNVHTNKDVFPKDVKDVVKVDLTFGTEKTEDVYAKIMGCDLFIYPSLCEGFGIPVLEAMRFKKPIVYNDAPAFNSFAVGYNVKPKDYGVYEEMEFTYPLNILDSKNFAETIKYALENPKESAELGEKAYEKSLDYEVSKVYSVFAK
jgi:glycosyltransferase involved in cell wall biosynthesis